MQKITYGAMPEQMPQHYGTRVRFPSLMHLNQWTPDGRYVEGETFGVAELPLPIKLLDHDSDWGHVDSVISGRLDMVTIHEDGNVSAEGWLLDDENGRRSAFLVDAKAIRSNSVDLRDGEMKIKFPDFEDLFKEDEDGFITMPKIQRKFSNTKLAATTLVMIPAFADATAEVGAEITASFSAWEVAFEELEELTASLSLAEEQIVQPFDDFYIPEYDDPRGLPLTVDEELRVFGHLGLYNTCHTGFLDKCVMIPKSRTGYGHYCKSSVLTDRGLVRTGPIFLFGGHPENARPEQINQAYGGVENSWADVRVENGRHGPWVSGRVRPGTTPEMLYAARASRISGHWFDRELFASVSVNAEGFDVPYQYAQEGGHEYLTASFVTAGCGCGDLDPMVELAKLNLAMMARAN